MRIKNINKEVNVPSSYPNPTRDTFGTSENTEEKKKAIGIRAPAPNTMLLGKMNLPSLSRAISHKKNATVVNVEISILLLTSVERLKKGRKNTGTKNPSKNSK